MKMCLSSYFSAIFVTSRRFLQSDQKMWRPLSYTTTRYIIRFLQYLKDLKRRGARIIIGEFFERAARVTMCEAYKQGMTQRQGYVWFLPGWYHANWYDVDSLR